MGELTGATLPDPLAAVDHILELNFELRDDSSIPWDTLDAVRTRHRIDITGLNLSMTHRGNIYRNYVLLRAGAKMD